MQNLKKILFIVILFCIFFIFSANSYAQNISSNLSNSFFRLHILANSDSETDQNLKIKVRNEIIEYMKQITNSNNNKSEIIHISEQNLEKFKKISIVLYLIMGWKYFIT